MRKEHIGIIGAGLMGHGLAQLFALHGHSVALYDLNQQLLDTAVDHIKANLELMTSRGIATEAAAGAVPNLIRTTTVLEEAARGADFVIEAVIENMPVKQDIFQKLDAVCPPETVLASNTSVMSITEIGSRAKHRARIAGTHFWNPPHIVPLVEVVQTEHTAPASVDFCMDILRRVGKRPIHCRKDVPGFIGNRMLHALWREALYIVEQGIADPATVDDAIRQGFGLRLPVLGPMANIDMVGLDLVLAIETYLLPHLCRDTAPSRLLRDGNANGALGFKTGKGLQVWTAEQAAAERRKLQEYLLDGVASRKN
ncbi:MAG: 3-hydroxyacyl-CoA dehydrogenase family protein [Deltaproteobacteria bacterium]|jgi:3-hydroxybutyryl-CoA dehydrogenase|nr:3-hydroxyacyl-CoA dehydrogenase family protein [Deltaproteobacteria bacterium]